MRNLHKLESHITLQNDHNQNQSKGGRKNTHTKGQHVNTCSRSKYKREHKSTQEQLKTGARISPKSLDGVVTERWSDGVLLVCFGTGWRHLGGPFYGPKGPRSRWLLHLEAKTCLFCVRIGLYGESPDNEQ
jgi:hypothetical protein